MRTFAGAVAAAAALTLAGGFAPSAPAATPASDNAGCVAQFVHFFLPLVHPYGDFVAPLAQAEGALGRGVSAVATSCERPPG